MSFKGFPPETLGFLEGIHAHNEKAWFDENRALYEAGYVAPARAFVEELGPRLKAIAPEVQYEAKVNGSMSRINRDIRFSKDKRPYKTNVGIQFRHAAGKDVHAPGFYLHLSPGEIFCGIGMWRPDKVPLQAIREAIAEAQERALAVVEDPDFAGAWRLGGEALTRAPKGFEKDHPAIEHIKRKANRGCTITPDNAGLDFKDGSRLRWQDGSLELDGHALTQARVDSFLVHRRDHRLVVNMVLSSPPMRDRILRYRGIYDL
ncbi:MAG: DUF2461 domain-containing protein [Candidatus Eremiobacteraeota bacterium]|nr:DUF2461 domain-containing protein [Candidatus Eremiobacteraeota bacterium]